MFPDPFNPIKKFSRNDIARKREHKYPYTLRIFKKKNKNKNPFDSNYLRTEKN